MKKNILFIHQAFPGQFHQLSRQLAREGHNVAGLALSPQSRVEGVTLIQYKLVRTPQEDLSPVMNDLDVKMVRGESAAAAMTELRRRNFYPDVVYAHPGWGEALFVKDIWPETRLVVYAEWFYNAIGQEVNFDPEFSPIPQSDQLRLRIKNTSFLHALNDADAAVAPTHWQKSRFPAWAQEKIQVIHDGLDIPRLKKGIAKSIKIPSKSISLSQGDPVVTFVSRHLEPVRGFHIFMRALPSILKQRPDAHIVIMGRDAGAQSKGYGPKNPRGEDWRKTLEKEIGKDLIANQVHFLGYVPYNTYIGILRMSACHVYLTTPFILSWSFLEAAAMGVPIVGSRTAPVEEFAHLNGLELLDFFDYNELAAKVVNILSQPVVRTPNALENQSLATVIPQLKTLLLGSDAVAETLDMNKISDTDNTIAEPRTYEKSPAVPVSAHRKRKQKIRPSRRGKRVISRR